MGNCHGKDNKQRNSIVYPPEPPKIPLDPTETSIRVPIEREREAMKFGALFTHMRKDGMFQAQ